MKCFVFVTIAALIAVASTTVAAGGGKMVRGSFNSDFTTQSSALSQRR